MSARSIDFAIIGAQKAGSTFLQDGLAEHPGIFLPHDEVPYFDDPSQAPEDEAFWPYFRPAQPGQILGFKRPNLLASSTAPARLDERFPGLKVIAILRDPLERLVSAYYHYMRSGFVPVRELDSGLPAILDHPRPHTRDHELLEFSLYGKHLERWVGQLGHERVKVVILEEERDQRAVLRELAGFVGAEPSRVGDVPRRRMQGTYSIPRLRAWRAVSPLIYSYGPRRDRVRPRHRVLLAAWRRVDQHVLSRFWPDEKPRIPAAVVERVRAELEADRARLEVVLARRVEAW